MLENLSNALIITVVGMSLVFGSILLLWAVMALLVRLTADRSEIVAEETASSDELKQRAAAVAVAAALSQRNSFAPHEFPLPPTPLVTAWQAVKRSQMLNRRRQLR
jgi:Na+-transporting methylmalonyl-CoA/oxaloacetate decarboxylase gamma subunit